MLVEVLRSLSDAQKTWIISTGFESILSFQLKEYPLEISRFLLSCFQPNPPILRINDNSYEVSEEDVHEILGLPIGETDIYFDDSTEVITDWAKDFGEQKKIYQVTPMEVCKAITTSDSADYQFKRNFIMLLSNIFIEGSSNPYMNTRMIKFNGDLDSCKKYNWCKYLVHCLQEQFVDWNMNREKAFFKGSLTFLMVCNV